MSTYRTDDYNDVEEGSGCLFALAGLVLIGIVIILAQLAAGI